MPISYKCKEGDRIDLIVFDNYGDLEMLPHVLATNVHLSKMPLVLKKDTVINLPTKILKPKASNISTGELW